MLIYRVGDETFEDEEDAVDYCISEDYHEDDDYFEEWVNDSYDHVTIGSETYYPYDILCNADDYNFRDLKSEYCEEQNESDKENALYELHHSEAGDSVDCQNYTIYIEETEETDDFDGDDELESVRTFILEQNLLEETKATKEKEEENDIMKLFQVIGG